MDAEKKLGAQNAVFEEWKQVGKKKAKDSTEEAAVRIRRDPSETPDPARVGELTTPFSFLKEQMRELSARKKKIDLNREQKDFLALIAMQLEKMREAGYRIGADGDQPDNKEDVPDVKPMRIFLGGPGGAGKSECIDIAGRMIERFFGKGSRQVLAASNSAARGVGGETVHSGLYLGGQCAFKLRSKTFKQAPSQDCKVAWDPVKALFLEEVSMISPAMLACISYRLCRARKDSRPWLDEALYECDEHMYGGLPIVVLLGDFMQLGAMERGLGRVSLVMKPKSSWYDECFAGRRIFWDGLTHVVLLREVHRFWDKDMPDFLEYMRDPTPGAMPKRFQEMLSGWSVRDMKDPKYQAWRARVESKEWDEGTDERKGPWRTYDMAVAWHAVQRLLHYRARRDAQGANQLLLYAQAVETCTTQCLSQAELRRALQVVNMNTTGKLLGYLPLYKGMRVRLCAKLCSKYQLVHDAVGTATDVILHARDQPAADAWQAETHKARKDGVAQLQCLQPFVPSIVAVTHSLERAVPDPMPVT